MRDRPIVSGRWYVAGLLLFAAITLIHTALQPRTSRASELQQDGDCSWECACMSYSAEQVLEEYRNLHYDNSTGDYAFQSNCVKSFYYYQDGGTVPDLIKYIEGFLFEKNMTCQRCMTCSR